MVSLGASEYQSPVANHTSISRRVTYFRGSETYAFIAIALLVYLRKNMSFIKWMSKVSFYSHSKNYELGFECANGAYPQVLDVRQFNWHRLIAMNPSARFSDCGCVPIKTKISF